MLSIADIADPVAVESSLELHQPAVALNAAGKTGVPNIDWCEQNREATFRSNVVGAATLARVCADHGVFLVHLSSGCLFHGEAPHADGWREDDPPAPLSYYAETKLIAEQAVREYREVAVLRIRMIVDTVPSPRNMITRLCSYAQVLDVTNSMTVVQDLARAIAHVARARTRGTVHVVNPGGVAHRDVIAWYRTFVNSSHTCDFIEEADFMRIGLGSVARSTCVLSSKRLAGFGVELRTGPDAVLDAVRRYGRSLQEAP